jgi:cytochrome b pre-mRNA-processing protein 3
MFNLLPVKSSAKVAGERLYVSAVNQARREALYERMGVPDTVEGRFELLTLHVILLVDRLKDASDAGKDVRQILFDVYLSNLDAALREMGVGDLAVGKRMRKLGEAFYGRARSYGAAFEALPDLRLLEETVVRTLAPHGTAESARDLAAYVAGCRESLAAGDTRSTIAGTPRWPGQ